MSENKEASETYDEDEKSVEKNNLDVQNIQETDKLDVDQLVMNVMEQLNTFNPNRKVIKKRIDGLIAREYLARDGPTSLTYDAGST